MRRLRKPMRFHRRLLLAIAILCVVYYCNVLVCMLNSSTTQRFSQRHFLYNSWSLRTKRLLEYDYYDFDADTKLDARVDADSIKIDADTKFDADARLDARNDADTKFDADAKVDARNDADTKVDARNDADTKFDARNDADARVDVRNDADAKVGVGVVRKPVAADVSKQHLKSASLREHSMVPISVTSANSFVTVWVNQIAVINSSLPGLHIVVLHQETLSRMAHRTFQFDFTSSTDDLLHFLQSLRGPRYLVLSIVDKLHDAEKIAQVISALGCKKFATVRHSASWSCVTQVRNSETALSGNCLAEEWQPANQTVRLSVEVAVQAESFNQTSSGHSDDLRSFCDMYEGYAVICSATGRKMAEEISGERLRSSRTADFYILILCRNDTNAANQLYSTIQSMWLSNFLHWNQIIVVIPGFIQEAMQLARLLNISFARSTTIATKLASNNSEAENKILHPAYLVFDAGLVFSNQLFRWFESAAITLHSDSSAICAAVTTDFSATMRFAEMTHFRVDMLPSSSAIVLSRRTFERDLSSLKWNSVQNLAEAIDATIARSSAKHCIVSTHWSSTSTSTSTSVISNQKHDYDSSLHTLIERSVVINDAVALSCNCIQRFVRSHASVTSFALFLHMDSSDKLRGVQSWISTCFQVRNWLYYKGVWLHVGKFATLVAVGMPFSTFRKRRLEDRLVVLSQSSRKVSCVRHSTNFTSLP